MQETFPHQCECGCGELVRRRFLPGHDGRLKGRLIAQARDHRWWVREQAVVAMVERGWGHFLPAETVANTTVRSRHRGRFVETRHVDSLHGVVLDRADVAHSHWSCPETAGKGRWCQVQEQSGWLCATCIHTSDWAEIVGHRSLQTH